MVLKVGGTTLRKLKRSQTRKRGRFTEGFTSGELPYEQKKKKKIHFLHRLARFLGKLNTRLKTLVKFKGKKNSLLKWHGNGNNSHEQFTSLE